MCTAFQLTGTCSWPWQLLLFWRCKLQPSPPGTRSASMHGHQLVHLEGTCASMSASPVKGPLPGDLSRMTFTSAAGHSWRCSPTVRMQTMLRRTPPVRWRPTLRTTSWKNSLTTCTAATAKGSRSTARGSRHSSSKTLSTRIAKRTSVNLRTRIGTWFICR
uniref:Putative secreted protein n=1 Tax=Ixodes ricinus TaxID=34613 RepID=A0A6B0UX94_IXORI